MTLPEIGQILVSQAAARQYAEARGLQIEEARRELTTGADTLEDEMGAYTNNGKRRSSQTHAQRVRTCVCGKVCRGNGGWSSHKRACLAIRPRLMERMRPQAEAHAAADRDCGRDWSCACGACRVIRKAGVAL